MDELLMSNFRELKRHLNSIEHMIYVSCKFTRTTEMLKKVMETIVNGYEQFFAVAYHMFAESKAENHTVHDKIQLLKDNFMNSGIHLDMSDYFLLKRLLLSEFECIGEYRKNLCMVSYIDGKEYIINIVKLLEFYNTLKEIVAGLNTV